MVKQELIDALSKRTGTTAQLAGDCVNAALDIIKEQLVKGNDITLRGFGTLKVTTAKEKRARVIATNTPLTIPAHAVVKFKPAAQLKDAVGKIRQTPDPHEQDAK